MKESTLEQGTQYCTFRLADLLLGVDVQCVQEVIRFQEMTPVPLAQEAVRGLINLRGQIVTAIDLRCQLSLPKRDAKKRPMNVVIRTGDGAVSLLVDEIGDVIEVDEESFEPPPETISETTRECVRGIHKLDGRLMLVLDPLAVTAIRGHEAAPAETLS